MGAPNHCLLKDNALPMQYDRNIHPVLRNALNWGILLLLIAENTIPHSFEQWMRKVYSIAS